MKQLLSDSQLDKFADILISIGQVLLASIGIPFFFGLDRVGENVVQSGLVLMFSSWVFSLLVVKGGEERK